MAGQMPVVVVSGGEFAVVLRNRPLARSREPCFDFDFVLLAVAGCGMGEGAHAFTPFHNTTSQHLHNIPRPIKISSHHHFPPLSLLFLSDIAPVGWLEATHVRGKPR